MSGIAPCQHHSQTQHGPKLIQLDCQTLKEDTSLKYKMTPTFAVIQIIRHQIKGPRWKWEPYFRVKLAYTSLVMGRNSSGSCSPYVILNVLSTSRGNKETEFPRYDQVGNLFTWAPISLHVSKGTSVHCWDSVAVNWGWGCGTWTFRKACCPWLF